MTQETKKKEREPDKLREAMRKAAKARDLSAGPLRSAAEEIRQRLEDELDAQRVESTTPDEVDLDAVDQLLEDAEKAQQEAEEADLEKPTELTVGGLTGEPTPETTVQMTGAAAPPGATSTADAETKRSQADAAADDDAPKRAAKKNG